MIRAIAAFATAALIAGSAKAQGTDFAPVREADAFLRMIAGKALRMPLYGLTITLSPDGSISGSAMGWNLTGQWSWQDGYFCREIDWSGTPIPYNCQLVETSGDRLRFTVDQGAGDSAVFRLR